jgi:hypothetical protein
VATVKVAAATGTAAMRVATTTAAATEQISKEQQSRRQQPREKQSVEQWPGESLKLCNNTSFLFAQVFLIMYINMSFTIVSTLYHQY